MPQSVEVKKKKGGIVRFEHAENKKKLIK